MLYCSMAIGWQLAGVGTSVNPTLVRLTDSSVRPTYCGSTTPTHQLLLSLHFPVLKQGWHRARECPAGGTGHASALVCVGNPHCILIFSYKDTTTRRSAHYKTHEITTWSYFGRCGSCTGTCTGSCTGTWNPGRAQSAERRGARSGQRATGKQRQGYREGNAGACQKGGQGQSEKRGARAASGGQIPELTREKSWLSWLAACLPPPHLHLPASSSVLHRSLLPSRTRSPSCPTSASVRGCDAACSTTRLSVAFMRSGLSFVLINMLSTISLASLCCCRTPALLSLRPTCSAEYLCLRFLEFAE